MNLKEIRFRFKLRKILNESNDRELQIVIEECSREKEARKRGNKK